MPDAPNPPPTAESDAGLRADVAEVIYRELGDMVNRDYLIDALMPVVTGDASRATGIELHCDDCQQPYGVWFAENAVWNLVMGGPEAKGDPGGMLCPRCFTLRAEACLQQTAIWRLTLDNADRVIPPGGSDA